MASLVQVLVLLALAAIIGVTAVLLISGGLCIVHCIDQETGLFNNVLNKLNVYSLQDDASQNNLCDAGWNFNNGMCYQLRDEYEDFDSAMATCNVFGAQLAYARDYRELSYLVNVARKSNHYGLWYGVQVSSVGSIGIYNENSERFIYEANAIAKIPLEATSTKPETKYVGLVRDASHYSGLFYNMVDVPKQVRLPYICRGDPDKVTLKADGDHLVRNSSQDVYWFSSRHDRRPYDEAAKVCKGMGMTLLSIRSAEEMDVIANKIEMMEDRRVDPWWTGLQVNQGKFAWSDGVNMEPSIINWNTRQSRGSPLCRILLSTGILESESCYDAKAPIICMKDHSMNGKFGCPHNWARAGQSCYRTPTHQFIRMYQSQAENICSKAGGHLISIDTPLEKTWLMQSTLTDGLFREAWTSLKNKNGKFVWANGNTPSASVMKWSTGSFLDREGSCFSLDHDVLRKMKCEYYSRAGCQYSPKKGKCATTNWTLINGKCYWLTQGRTTSYADMLHLCYQDVLKHDYSIEVQPLKVDSKELLDKILKVTQPYQRIWIGLKEVTRSVFAWADGTPANISIFKTTYKKSHVSTDDRCAVINQHGEFEMKSCTTCKCGRVICERPVGSGGTRLMTPSSFSQIMTIFSIVTMVVYSFL